MLRYGSVCSGIESASVAWEPLGMSAAWFSEIEPFPCSVLAHHWPHVTNFGDMTQLPTLVRMGLIEAPDVLVGGTPCQAFSVAGKRDSLDDERGQLTLTYVDLLNAIDEQRVGNECIAVWENVPGVLNTKDNAFGCFLGELSGSGCELQPSGRKWGNAGCVFGPQRAVAWRVIDAQHFGVAQRRSRVFVVASARNGFDPTKILFESEGVRRDIAPSRKAREEVTGFTTSSVGQCCEGVGSLRVSGGDSGGHVQVGYRMVAFGEYADDDTASTMKARDYKDATDLCLSVHGTQDPCVSNNLAFALGCNGGAENAVAYHQSVRRLTPVECERLQGFPDGHTDVLHKGKPAADGPRYKAIGNSKAVPCIQWIGARLITYQMGLL
jgi:DNA (cytosine-5)-methyltransferase 1